MRAVKSFVPALLFVLVAACGGADASSARTAAPAPTDEVRALVVQYGLGGGEKDVAGEAFYNLDRRAVPGLLEVARDPATSHDDLETIIFIASTYVPDPEIFDALRTRAQAMPDPADRELRIRLIDALSANAVAAQPQ